MRLDAKHLKSAITAMEFGDGYLDMNAMSAKARFGIYHSAEHLDYMEWKQLILQQVSNVTAQIVTKDDTRHGYRLQTNFHRYFYKIGVQSFKQRVKNLFTPIGLAVWWQDSGTLCQSGGEYKYAHLSIQGYTVEEIKCIITAWNNHFGWSPKLAFYQQKNYGRGTTSVHRLILRKSEAILLSEYIKDFVQDSFKYKLLLSA